MYESFRHQVKTLDMGDLERHASKGGEVGRVARAEIDRRNRLKTSFHREGIMFWCAILGCFMATIAAVTGILNLTIS